MTMKNTYPFSAAKFAVLFGFLKKKGVDPGALLSGPGLDPAVSGSPDTRISLETVESIFLRSAALSGDEFFGLHLGGLMERG